MDQLTLAGVLVLLGAIAADRYWPRQTASIETEVAGVASRTVGTAGANGLAAVLRFRNRSEDAFFAEGMHDDLLTQLQHPESRVGRVLASTAPA